MTDVSDGRTDGGGRASQSPKNEVSLNIGPTTAERTLPPSLNSSISFWEIRMRATSTLMDGTPSAHRQFVHIQSWPKTFVLGCVISPLRQQAESRNLGHTFLASSVQKETEWKEVATRESSSSEPLYISLRGILVFSCPTEHGRELETEESPQN